MPLPCAARTGLRLRVACAWGGEEYMEGEEEYVEGGEGYRVVAEGYREGGEGAGECMTVR